MEVENRGQKSLILILARELAANVATPILITDPWGKMVFYNEAAEKLLGQAFRKSGELEAENWRATISPSETDGSPVPYDELPLVIALTQRKPNHRAFVITGFDGKTHLIEATSYPLIGNSDKLAGAVSIFWDTQQD
ncbi:MAG TPA: PAS domain-containing protein [Candidatus Dormibacteraeota bacterium]|jgi:PAS domain-containing protein|nr:PAS domain-containing protein [Candidatus Dormibacteraeota bacterium]